MNETENTFILLLTPTQYTQIHHKFSIIIMTIDNDS